MYSVIELQMLVGPATEGVPAGAPFIFGKEWMFMAKQFLSFDEQIEYLEKEKNLIINDRDYARDTLKQIGYFSLIGGYKALFKNPTTHKYKDGVVFEDIVGLYNFDSDLRELFLKYILQIERHIRSLLSNYFTEKYGESQLQYLKAENFSTDNKYKRDIARLISKLNHLANITEDYPYINHQRKKHGNVPLWVVVNALTLGSLSKFYMLLTPDIKVKIAQNFEKVTDNQLQQYLIVITKFRNVCAHNERLYSYKINEAIPDTALHSKLKIPQKGKQYVYGKHNLFALVIAFRYLIPNEDFNRFKKGLSVIIKKYCKSYHTLTESQLLEFMGFPENWEYITRYGK